MEPEECKTAPCEPESMEKADRKASDLSTLEIEVKELVSYLNKVEGNSVKLLDEIKDDQRPECEGKDQVKEKPKNRIINLTDRVRVAKRIADNINERIAEIGEMVGK